MSFRSLLVTVNRRQIKHSNRIPSMMQWSHLWNSKAREILGMCKKNSISNIWKVNNNNNKSRPTLLLACWDPKKLLPSLGLSSLLRKTRSWSGCLPSVLFSSATSYVIIIRPGLCHPSGTIKGEQVQASVNTEATWTIY